MEIAIRTIGNSKGVVLPKPLLAQVGLDAESSAEVVVENGCIVLRKPTKPVRAGWADAAAAVAAQGGDALLMGEFANAGDEELGW
ncbi:AbrB/MazE/SpoVT family DNA-binding domain-containing protein [Curvibacter sp. CHRR-16]|uniref:AbrB/MazE/SpoVT family DNA-binding domain-containing protein n=1 Tax=Curvibacter sp. CHRR-16 TaxID=2835872 RepID=UPI001BDA86FC|nr:AbrB/MazE/SpoVT family DNA-binding domain-containing protein [Curvibacter sp. CHRR-16]MBT0570800.1 AbrB/MazE/SpoVT family DNA-binding domain-containing protein [Curvibacter sp. CHRR-16]